MSLESVAAPPGHHRGSEAFSPGWRRALVAAALASLALRSWLALRFPITGDEAFFYWWGVYPAWGYSDHPPMVGWWLAAMRALGGDGLLSLRLPAVLLPLAVGALVGWALWPSNRERAAWAMLLVWLAPLNWLNMIITTDTPLVLWSAVSLACLLRAEQRPRIDGAAWALYAAAGLAWSLAFLSKYFAVLLALGMLAYGLLWRRERWRAYALVMACALPGPLVNMAWNMSHGWPNILFNVFNRHEDARLTLERPLLYALTLAYLLTPVLVWQLWRHRKTVAIEWRRQRLLACAVMVPLAVLAFLSLKKVVGLHWPLSFYPWALALSALVLPRQALAASARGMAAFTGLHVLVVAALALTSLPQWQGSSWYPSMVRSFRTTELLARFDRPGTVLMAEAYTPASIYGYTLGRYVPVFGVGRFHSRQDDQLVDFSAYRGRTLRIVHKGEPDLAEFTPYFDSVRLEVIEQDGARFHVVEGRGFNDAAYREKVLWEIHRRFHQVPAWLPMTGSPFNERLCGAVRCSPKAPAGE